MWVSLETGSPTFLFLPLVCFQMSIGDEMVDCVATAVDYCSLIQLQERGLLTQCLDIW